MTGLIALCLGLVGAASHDLKDIEKSLRLSDPPPSLVAVRVARGVNVPRDAFIEGGTLPPRIDVAFAFFVIRGPGQIILVDTGFTEATTAAGWGVTDYRSPLSSLGALNIDPQEVTDVVLTHHHWDHVGGIAPLSRARVHLTKHTLTRTLQWSRKHPEIAQAFERAQAEGRVHLVRTPTAVAPYLMVVPVGLHTPGFMLALLARPDGVWVLASDLVPLWANLEHGQATGQTSHRGKTLALMSDIRALVGGDLHRVVVGHDLRLFNGVDIRTLDVPPPSLNPPPIH